MKKFKSHFKFNKQERSGIFFLLLFIILLQIAYFVWKSVSFEDPSTSLQVDVEMQTKIDALKEKAIQKDSFKIFPFNPNFISDYKGYTLGMSVEEIDRLHQFRSAEKFVNSAKEFQVVTNISDSLLNVISPYFKFPEWTQKNEASSVVGRQDLSNRSSQASSKGSKTAIADLNSATAEELRTITGIGEKLSARIIKFRDRLGGFLVEEQLYDVYGLETDVADRALDRFKLLTKPQIEKVDINTATIEELAQVAYIRYEVAAEILAYRAANEKIISFDELSHIEDFPVDKIDRIALYLSL